MDLNALTIIKKLEILIDIAETQRKNCKDKNASGVAKGEWTPITLIKQIVADYYKEWDKMCDEHHKDYLKRKGEKNGNNS